MKIFGLDLSLDHGGLVVLNSDGVVIDYAYITSVKKSAGIDPEHSILLSKKGKEEPKETFRLRRMKEYLAGILRFQLRTIGIGPVSTMDSHYYYSIEGYSYASQSTSICQIAELTGYLKYYIFNKEGNKIRIHDPLSVKLFATNKGNASKKEMVEQALLAFDIPEGLIQRKMIKKKKFVAKIEEYDGAGTDLADAYFLARMLYKELQLRSGNVLLSQLNEGERRIFLRVSRAYPVNILDRTFIHKGE